MRTIQMLLTAMLLSAAIGCADDPRPNDGAEERAIASIVALVSGDESGGLVATLGELAGDSLVEEEEPPLVVHASRVENHPDVRTLVTRRHGASALGESRYRCTVEPAAEIEHGAGKTVVLAIDGESRHASAAMAIRARTNGSIVMAAAGPLRERMSAGELRIAGALGDLATERSPFTEIEATLTWSRLRLRCSASRDVSIAGELTVSIAGRGERGLVLRNGTLHLDGSERGMLELGGRRYPIDIRRARTTR